MSIRTFPLWVQRPEPFEYAEFVLQIHIDLCVANQFHIIVREMRGIRILGFDKTTGVNL